MCFQDLGVEGICGFVVLGYGFEVQIQGLGFRM